MKHEKFHKVPYAVKRIQWLQSVWKESPDANTQFTVNKQTLNLKENLN